MATAPVVQTYAFKLRHHVTSQLQSKRKKASPAIVHEERRSRVKLRQRTTGFPLPGLSVSKRRRCMSFQQCVSPLCPPLSVMRLARGCLSPSRKHSRFVR